MIRLDIPGRPSLCLEHLVVDFNGTLACDGTLVAGVRDRLNRLARLVRIHIVTADTFNRARDEVGDLTCELCLLEPHDQAQAKLEYVQRLGAERSACIGNGRNDALMMGAAALGIAVVQAEGASPATLCAADVVQRDICEALDLFFHPQRLVATLRT
jgi:soluble P-type ATPase